MGLKERTPTTVDEYNNYKVKYSNWGRWGSDDQKGTLNHINESVTKHALSLVQDGVSISCANPIATKNVIPDERRNPRPADHQMTIGPSTSADYIGVYYHGFVNTHIDSLCHFFTGNIEDSGRMYNNMDPKLVTEGIINLHRAGLDFVTSEELETHYLASGDVSNVVNALIAADKANIELDYKTATAIDLAGRDVQEAVQTSVNPKVIDCPKEGKVSAVAKDGIELKAKARVTVRTNIDQLVGGATDDTIIARVGQGIVSAIGSSANYKIVLENPDEISRAVLSKGLDSGTAYAILSIDIADVDVGKNVGADLETDQAEADKKVAQARAESRRAMAVAAEQEMKAKVASNRSELVLAEAEVPLAMAEAFRDGNIHVNNASG